MIRDFTPRLYQERIFSTCAQKNTLVVLPTGLGKTNIFMMLAAHRLKLYPNSKVLFIGPTRPLIDQYKKVFEEHLDIDASKMTIFTGMVSPAKRAKLWKESSIIFATPQGIENDIISKRIDLSEVSLLGVDEAHRAVGDYAYVFVAKQYHKLGRFSRIVGLTASPGSDMDRISEVCGNLFVEDIEIRTNEDPDVKPYIQEIDISWKEVELTPELKEVQKYLKDLLKDRLGKLKRWGVLQRVDVSAVSKKDLLGLQGSIQGNISRGEKDPVMWSAISVLAEVMKASHALELLESQGLEPFYSYMKKLYDESFKTKTKAVKNLVVDPNFKSALYKAEKLHMAGFEHPKLGALYDVVSETIKGPEKMIIFTQFRDNAVAIKKKLDTLSSVSSAIFVGQAKKRGTGSSQKEQKAILDDFRSGMFNVIIATSIGEEGLDIPQVDCVLFYEPVPSAIRTIQRRGRTGRQDKGKVVMLVTKDTRDVAYKWTAHHKEKRMYRNLESLKKSMFGVMHSRDGQKTVSEFGGEQIVIFADHREKHTGVVKALIDENVDVKLEQLPVADYVLSKRCGVELKTVPDFVNSIIDGRLLDQLKDLSRNFARPVVIIQGSEDIYSVRKVHKHAIQGMLATIAVSYGIPLVFTKHISETASLLKVIAKREQDEGAKPYDMHGEKKPLSLREQQEYIVGTLPGIGPTLAKPLLTEFGSVRAVIEATAADLEKVEKIGKIKAADIRKVLDAPYEG